jgi:hypothetical protein
MRRTSQSIALLVSAIVALALCWAAGPLIGMARNTYLGEARAHYPGITGSRIDNCRLCHLSLAGGGQINDFGWDWWNAGGDAAAFNLVEGLDSDADGYTNVEELIALTYPGDASDSPIYTPTSTATITPTPTSTPTTSATPTITQTPMASPTPTRTATVIGSPTTTRTPSITPTRTASPTHTSTLLFTLTPSPTRTASPTLTATPLATVTGPTGQVHGVVKLEGRTNHEGVVVSVGGRFGLTNSSGQYRVDSVPAGAWSAVASHQGYLSALRLSVLILSGQDLLLPETTLLGGDVTGDCIVNLFDLVAVGVAYAPAGPLMDPRADINADGVVDLFDLVIVATSYGLSCPLTW